jgi:hypothetical protein
VQHGSSQFSGAGRDCEAVEECLRFTHESSQLLSITGLQGLDCQGQNAAIGGTEQLLDSALDLVRGKGVAAVEVVQDLLGVFLRAQVHEDEIHVLTDLHLVDGESIAVEGH